MKIETNPTLLPQAAIDAGTFRAGTFEEARSLTKELGPQLTIGLLNGDLKDNYGNRVLHAKSYLDMVKPDSLEEEAIVKPDVLGALHTDMASMIADNLQISVHGHSSESLTALAKSKKVYKTRVISDSMQWHEMLSEFATNGEAPVGITSKGDFRGLLATYSSGETVDLSDFGVKVQGVRPNIRVQREISANFVHWETMSACTAKARGEEVEYDNRIYLNPRITESSQIFETVMRKLDSEGLQAHGKILDRAYELAGKMMTKKAGTIRADGIVLAMKRKDADVVLQIVKEVYMEYEDSFTGRPTAKIPTIIADGLAVGDEPNVKGESLTSHRAKIIESARKRTKEIFGLNPGDEVPTTQQADAHSRFIEIFRKLAADEGVDPNNPAFNLDAA